MKEYSALYEAGAEWGALWESATDIGDADYFEAGYLSEIFDAVPAYSAGTPPLYEE